MILDAKAWYSMKLKEVPKKNPRSTQKYQKVSKSLQKYPKVPNSVPKSTQKYQKSQKAPKRT